MARQIPQYKTLLIATRPEPSRVQTFGRFTESIAGQRFVFHVTQSQSDAFGKVVTHEKSGMKVCDVSVGAAYLTTYAKAPSDVERGKTALRELVERVGAARVRSVIAGAPALPREEATS